jgi:hypothetical protein
MLEIIKNRVRRKVRGVEGKKKWVNFD